MRCSADRNNTKELRQRWPRIGGGSWGGGASFVAVPRGGAGNRNHS